MHPLTMTPFPNYFPLLLALLCIVTTSSTPSTPTRPLAFSNPFKRQPADPTLAPTPLLMFTGDNCAHCDEMEPIIDRVERDLNVRVHRFNVWRDQINFKLFEKLDKNRKCGGLPYFYNTATKQGICGASTYGNFRLWARNRPCSFYFYNPGAAEKLDAAGGKKVKRGVGMWGRLSMRFDSKKEETKQLMTDKLEEVVESARGGK